MTLRLPMLIALACVPLLSACAEDAGTSPSGDRTVLPPPPTGERPIVVNYGCTDGNVLTVTYDRERDVAVVEAKGLDPQTLPQKPSGSGVYYTNGRYYLQGKGDDVQWGVGRALPLKCSAEPSGS